MPRSTRKAGLVPRFPASHEPPGGASQEPCAHLRSKCAPRMGGGSRSFILARLELASRHPTNRLAALRGNPVLTSDQNALRAWVHKNFGAFAPYKRFAQQNLGGGRIHFARAFQFPERNPKKEVTTYVVTSFLERATRLELATSTLARWRSTR